MVLEMVNTTTHRFANQVSRIVMEDGAVFDKTTKTIEMLGHHTEE
jgi:hypothetical protein